MRLSRSILAIAVAAAALTSRAQAQNYPWCAQYSGGGLGGVTSCSFVSFEQCMETMRGMGGFCIANNTYVPPPGPAARPPAGRHRGHKR